MKKIAFVLIAIAIVSSAAMAGDMAKMGQWGIQTSLGGGVSNPVLSTGTIGLKFMASENMAVRVMLGFASNSPAGSGGSTSGYDFGAGFEYHMTAIGSLSPYVGLQANYAGGSVPSPSTGTAPPTPSAFSVAGVWGAEYFFSSNFSWGGELNIGYTSTSNQVSGVDSNGNPTYGSSSTIGTGSVATILTWYMN